MKSNTHGSHEKCIQNFTYKTRMKEPAWWHRCTWDDEINVDPKQIGWEGMVWVSLDQNRGQWQAVMEMVMILQLS